MAASITPNLTDITLGEAADDGYWSGENGTSTEVFRQGSGAQAWIVSKNSSETAIFDAFSKSGLLNMSGTGVHLYITVRCDIAPFIDYLRVALQSDTNHGSSSNGTYWWTLVDNTANIEWYGEWKTFILDVNSSFTDADSTGTLDLAGVTDVHINVDNSNSGNIRSIENTYIDCVRFGTGLTITGTAWDWEDIASIDSGGNYKWDIIRKVGPGVFELNGQIQVGNGATTTTPSISNQTLFFKDPSTAGEASGPLGKLASGFYKVVITGSGCTVAFNNMSIISSSNYPFVLDADDVNLPSNSVDWNGGVIVEADSVLLKSSQSYQGLSFVNCGQLDPDTSTFEGNTISGYDGSYGALLWPGGTSVNNCNFNNNTRAIEVTQAANQTYDALFFSGNDYDTHLNNGGTDIDISKNNGSDATSYIATGGGTITYVGPSVYTTITVRDLSTGSVIQGALVLVKVTDGSNFPYQASISIIGSGTTATVTHNSHGLSTDDYIIIAGANEDVYNGVYAITVSDENTYTYTTNETIGSSPATGTVTATFAFIATTTDEYGEVQDQRVVSVDQSISGWARKSSSSPYYQQGAISGTVDNASGFSATILLARDE